jgi:CheY-like chemotaxis protein
MVLRIFGSKLAPWTVPKVWAKKLGQMQALIYENLRDVLFKGGSNMALPHNANPTDDETNKDALNILLVDDDQNLATTLSYGLRKALGKASSVVFCSSGLDAFAMMATQSFDVVISDYHMPGMSGLEVLKKIRQDHCEPSLLLITAYGTDTLEKEVYQLGFGYITKPFEMPSLLQSIYGLIKGKEKREGTKDSSHMIAQEGNADSSPLMSNAK